MYTPILCQYLMSVCVGMFIQEFWPLLRLLILLTLIWWQVSNISKISRIVLPWIQRAIDSHFGWNHWSIICHFGWNHWSIICLSKVSSWVSNVSKEWIWYAKSGISGPGVWSISPNSLLSAVLSRRRNDIFTIFYRFAWIENCQIWDKICSSVKSNRVKYSCAQQLRRQFHYVPKHHAVIFHLYFHLN